MVRLPMTLSEVKVTFAILNLHNTHNSGNTACFNSMCLHINRKAHASCDLNIIVKSEGLLKAVMYTGISETVLIEMLE